MQIVSLSLELYVVTLSILHSIRLSSICSICCWIWIALKFSTAEWIAISRNLDNYGLSNVCLLKEKLRTSPRSANNIAVFSLNSMRSCFNHYCVLPPAGPGLHWSFEVVHHLRVLLSFYAPFDSPLFVCNFKETLHFSPSNANSTTVSSWTRCGVAFMRMVLNCLWLKKRSCTFLQRM